MPVYLSPDWKFIFIQALKDGYNISNAAMTAKVARTYAYAVKKSDPEFSSQWDDAKDKAIDDVEESVFIRAKEGSDALAMFVLRSHRRKQYGERSKVDINSKNSTTQTHIYIPDNGRNNPDTAPDRPARDVPIDEC